MKFHTVLRPNSIITQAAESFAQENFKGDNVGYCLGGNGHLPHITIIQADIDDPATVNEIYNAIKLLEWDICYPLKFDSYYHTEEFYCGVAVINDPVLQELHEQALRVHHQYGIPVLNACGDDFFPHITLAKSEHYLSNPTLPIELTREHSGWSLEFGYRGDNGIYLGPYTP